MDCAIPRLLARQLAKSQVVCGAILNVERQESEPKTTSRKRRTERAHREGRAEKDVITARRIRSAGASSGRAPRLNDARLGSFFSIRLFRFAVFGSSFSVRRFRFVVFGSLFVYFRTLT